MLGEGDDAEGEEGRERRREMQVEDLLRGALDRLEGRVVDHAREGDRDGDHGDREQPIHSPANRRSRAWSAGR